MSMDGGIIENDLTEALITYLRDVVYKDLLLPCEAGGERRPVIHDGWMPPKRAAEQVTEWPAVLVRADAGTTQTDGHSTCSVKFLLGAFCDDHHGHRYPMEMMQRLRLAFMGLPSMTLNSRYKMELPFEWDLYDDQPVPIWMMEVRTQWAIATPQMANEEWIL